MYVYNTHEEHEIKCLDCAEGYYYFTDTDFSTTCDCCTSELTIDELLQELAERRFL